MQNPEQREPGQEPEQKVEQTKNDPIEVLREERKSPRMKELRREFRRLRSEQKWLELQYSFNEGGMRTGTIYNLPAEDRERVRQNIAELSEKLKKNESEQAVVRAELERLEDEAKERIKAAIKNSKK